MKNLNIAIKYLYHSGFTVETDQHLLVFDYYKGSFNLKNKKTYVFSSHSHPDHFNPEIFEWQKDHTGVEYILSSDIYDDPSIPLVQDNITFISPYETKQIDDVKIKAYSSTDEGVSFLVQCEGKNLFHAGDLNWWYWSEDTPEGKKFAEQGFKKEIAKIKGERIDVAFFPVDPRLENNFHLGGDYFINEINPGFFIPMHFWDNYGAVREFRDKIDASLTQLVGFTQRGQEIIVSI